MNLLSSLHWIPVAISLLLMTACGTFEFGVEPTPRVPAPLFTPAPLPLPSIQTTTPHDLSPNPALAPTATPWPTQTPYYTATPIPSGQLKGEWRNITTVDGLCTNTPLFIGWEFIGTGTTQMCYLGDEGWITVHVPQGTRVTAANRFPPGGGWEVATDEGHCDVPFGEWKCQSVAEGFLYSNIKAIVPLSAQSVYMLTDSVVFSSTTYRISDIVGDDQARPNWISISSEFFEAGFITPEIWVGTNGYGVVVIQPATGNIRRYTTADGLPSNTIRDVEAERCPKFCDFRDIWIATDRGVGHWNGTSWTTYTVANGLPSDDVRGVAFVQRNVVWAATAHGAAYFDGQTWQAFTYADGIPVEDLQGVTDGRGGVWFNTLGQGLVIFEIQSPTPSTPTASVATMTPPSNSALVYFLPSSSSQLELDPEWSVVDDAGFVWTSKIIQGRSLVIRGGILKPRKFGASMAGWRVVLPPCSSEYRLITVREQQGCAYGDKDHAVIYWQQGNAEYQIKGTGYQLDEVANIAESLLSVEQDVFSQQLASVATPTETPPTGELTYFWPKELPADLVIVVDKSSADETGFELWLKSLTEPGKMPWIIGGSRLPGGSCANTDELVVIRGHYGCEPIGTGAGFGVEWRENGSKYFAGGMGASSVEARQLAESLEPLDLATWRQRLTSER